ncbi:MAG: homoserine dehydrogenase, partial [Sandaracinaceae bacterium]|nr:homoserine dehydrogenase [Sandaracinaceae bacterium]
MKRTVQSDAKIRIGLIGAGVVGQGILQLLHDNAPSIERRLGARIEVRRVIARDRDKPRSELLTPALLSFDPNDVLDDPDVDVVVEVIGGVGIAKQVVEAALAAGKPVVTCNKKLIAKHGPALFRQARDGGVDLAFEGSVGGGIPILSALRSCLAGNRVQAV